MNPLLAALFATLLLLASAPGSNQPAPSRPTTPFPTSPPQPIRSSVTEISGTYVLAAEHVWITAGKAGITEIQSSRHWDAVGFFDGRQFTGLLRKLDESNLPADSAAYGSLRFTLQADRTLKAVLQFAGAATPRQARWTPAKDWHPEE